MRNIAEQLNPRIYLKEEQGGGYYRISGLGRVKGHQELNNQNHVSKLVSYIYFRFFVLDTYDKKNMIIQCI